MQYNHKPTTLHTVDDSGVNYYLVDKKNGEIQRRRRGGNGRAYELDEQRMNKRKIWELTGGQGEMKYSGSKAKYLH